MLTKVEVRNSQGALLALPLEDVSSGFVVEDIQGLDPVKATLVSSSFAGSDGEQYQSSRRESRNIKIILDLEPDYAVTSVRDLRKRLYAFFMPKTEVSLRFYMFDGLIVDILGRVESFDAPLFAKDPQATISITSFDPDFINLIPITLSGISTAGSTETLINYVGTVETGLRFVLNVDRPLSEFTIYHRPPDGTIRSLDFAGSLVAGNVLAISTIFGAKGAIVTKAGSDSSMLYGISQQSKWIELENGDNYIRVYAAGVGIPFTITYTPRYGGL